MGVTMYLLHPPTLEALEIGRAYWFGEYLQDSRILVDWEWAPFRDASAYPGDLTTRAEDPRLTKEEVLRACRANPSDLLPNVHPRSAGLKAWIEARPGPFGLVTESMFDESKGQGKLATGEHGPWPALIGETWTVVLAP